MKKFPYPALAAAALLTALPAHAQDDAAQADDENSIVIADRSIEPGDIIVVANGVASQGQASGRAVTVIDRNLIEQRQSVALSDILATMPGVNVSRNGGVGSFTGVRIRAAEAEQTLVLIDGVRVNDPSSPAGTFDFGNLLTSAISRVEVLRGPNSVVWGGQAIGGVVNVVTEESNRGLRARGNAEYGFADSLSANAAVAAGGEHVSGALTGGYYRSDGISAAAGGAEPDGYRQYGASGRLKVSFTDNVSAEVRGYFADSRAELDGFPPPTFSFTDTGEYSTARELYGYAGLNASLLDGDFGNRIAVTVANIHRDNFDPSVGAAPVFFGRGSSERYEYQGDARPTGWLRAIFGVEHEDSRFTDGFTPASTGITSGYGELIVEPVDTVTITGGVRYDDHQDFGGHTSLALSAAYHTPWETTIRVNYNEGFKAPTLYQLHSFFGDPTLQPETARSYEIGGEQRLFYERLIIGVSWFHRDTVNQIDFDLGTFTYGNVARTRAEGFELEARAIPIDDLVITANYTHLRAENRSPGGNLGNDLARRPRDAGSLSVDYSFAFGLKLGGTLLLVAASFDDTGNSTRLDGYALAGVRAAMRVSDQFEVYARVDNLFDEQYQTVAGYGTLGRAAYGGVRVKFQ
jgi:vitamin B12 transporter